MVAAIAAIITNTRFTALVAALPLNTWMAPVPLALLVAFDVVLTITVLLGAVLANGFTGFTPSLGITWVVVGATVSGVTGQTVVYSAYLLVVVDP